MIALAKQDNDGPPSCHLKRKRISDRSHSCSIQFAILPCPRARSSTSLVGCLGGASANCNEVMEQAVSRGVKCRCLTAILGYGIFK